MNHFRSRVRYLLRPTLVASSLMLSQGAVGADIHLALESARSGRLNGGLVLSYEHALASPVDSATGLPTGRRQHAPLVIVKRWDRSAPLLAAALVNNEQYKSVTLTVAGSRPDGGPPTPGHAITLSGARVVSFKIFTDDRGAERPPASANELVEIQFRYDKIEWTAGGVTAEDSWAAAFQ